MMNQLPKNVIEVARIAGPWGVKGSMRIISYSADADALFNCNLWYLLPPEAQFAPVLNAKDAQALPQKLNIQDIREMSKGIRVDALEVNSRELAQALKGSRIFIPRDDFPDLSDDEFYWIDLIGLQVVNTKGDDLGKVFDMMDNGPQSVLRISKSPTPSIKSEQLIPFVDAFVQKVDLAKGVIIVEWESDY